MDRRSELQSRLISQFRNASSIIQRLQVLRDSKKYVRLKDVVGIQEAVLAKQVESLRKNLLSMNKTMEEFHGIVLSLGKILRDGRQIVKGGGSNQLTVKQLQQRVGVKPSLADCLDGLMLLQDMHCSELFGELKKTVRNRAKPEGSIVEAWVQYESLTFFEMYLKDVETAFNRPQRISDGGVRKEKLSVFAQSARPFGDPGRGESFSRIDMEVAHWFVLNNCDEIITYLDEHEEMMKRAHPSHLYAKKHRELFPQWFLKYVNQLKASNSPTYSEELYNLAFGLIRAELFSGYNVNGVKFLGAAGDDKLCSQNSGVHVPGGGESTDIDFYGKLTTVVQLLYKDRYQVLMFKCRWFDTNPSRQGSVKIDHGLLSVNMNRTWYDDDPYILANMAKQVVYLDYPKAGGGWKVVMKMDQRNVYAIPEQYATDDNVENVADQRLESSMENDAETL